METVYFLCSSSEKNNFVLAIKNDESDWHYFEEEDSFLDAHGSLPSDLIVKISQLKTAKPIPLSLNAEQLCNYVTDSKFVFKGKELKTCKLCLGK